MKKLHQISSLEFRDPKIIINQLKDKIRMRIYKKEQDKQKQQIKQHQNLKSKFDSSQRG